MSLLRGWSELGFQMIHKDNSLPSPLLRPHHMLSLMLRPPPLKHHRLSLLLLMRRNVTCGISRFPRPCKRVPRNRLMLRRPRDRTRIRHSAAQPLLMSRCIPLLPSCLTTKTRLRYLRDTRTMRLRALQLATSFAVVTFPLRQNISSFLRGSRLHPTGHQHRSLMIL